MASRLEDILKRKFDSFEVQVGESNWHAINGRLDAPLESALKKKFNGYQAQINPALWASIEGTLPNSMENGLRQSLNEYQASLPKGGFEAIMAKTAAADPLKEVLSDKFSTFEAPVPSGSLTSIDAKLDAIKHRRRARRLAIPLMAALLILIPWRIWIPEWDAVNEKTTISFNEKPESSSTDKVTEGPEIDPVESFTTNNSRKVSTPESNADRKDNIEPPLNSNRELAENKLAVFPSGATDKESSSGSNPNETELNSAPGTINRLLAETQLIYTNPNRLNPDKAPLNALEVLVIISPEHAKTPALYAIEAGIAMGAFDLKTNPNSNNLLHSKDFAAFNDSLLQTGRYNSVNIGFSIPIKRNLELISGIGFNSVNFTTDFSTQNPYPDDPQASIGGDFQSKSYTNNNESLRTFANKKSELGLASQADFNNDSIVTGSDYYYPNHISFLELPIGVRKKFTLNDKSSLYISGGMKFGYVTVSETHHIAVNRKEIIKVDPTTTDQFYRLNGSAFTSLSYDHEIHKDLSLFASVEAQKSLWNMNKSNSWLGMRAQNLGLKLGVRQYIY